MTSEISADVKVQCFNCNSVLVTNVAQLKGGERFECRFCQEDLTPAHKDPECGFCRGEGFAMVNDVIWICLGAEE